jgi:hypothetical protein
MQAARFSPEEPPYGMLAGMAGSRYRERSGQFLRHCDGRAAGGEPCVMCGQLIQASAAGKHRERPVCRLCNVKLRRQLKRAPGGVRLPLFGRQPPRR